MNYVSRSLLAGGLLLMAQSLAVAQSATISIEVYSKNGVVIPGGPVSSAMAAPGDQFELIWRVRNWGTLPGPNNHLRGYQLDVPYSSFVSGSSGNVLPIGFSTITDPGGVCPNGDPMGGNNFENCFVDTARTDFVFAGHGTSFVTVSTSTCNYRWAGALLVGGAPDPGSGIREYLGSVRVQVSANATGTFTFTPNPDPEDGTFLRNQLDLPLGPVSFESCTLVLPGISAIIDSDPASGIIDARQPHSISNQNPAQGFNQIALLFSGSTAGMTANDFQVSVVPAGGVVPSIMTFVPAGNAAQITFNSRIPAGKWTRVRHIASDTDVCIGYLPGDVNNDRTASPVDILKLIDHLNGVEMYQPHQTDADRSGATNPADILRVIDLLNGADAFDVWNGMTLPVNPCN